MLMCKRLMQMGLTFLILLICTLWISDMNFDERWSWACDSFGVMIDVSGGWLGIGVDDYIHHSPRTRYARGFVHARERIFSRPEVLEWFYASGGSYWLEIRCLLITIVVLGLLIGASKIRIQRSFNGLHLCSYNLAGNISGVCPECGFPVTEHCGKRKRGSGKGDKYIF